MLDCLRFNDETLDWGREALHASHADERQEDEVTIKLLEAETKHPDERIHAIYVNKLDGLVDVAFFEKMSKQ